MEIGSSIRIFEILDKPQYSDKLVGLQRAEDINSEWFGNNIGVDLVTKDIVGVNLHVGINSRKDAKHVATMVITKLK